MRKYNGIQSELSKLIKSWNLIDMSTNSDLESLSAKILSKLLEGESRLKVKRILESELCVTYGLLKTEFDAERITNEVMMWWNKYV